MIPRSFEELVSLADLVVIGTVSTQQSGYDTPQENHISTYVTLSDVQVVKGALKESHYTLRLAGGEVDGRVETYPGLPELRKGERYVLFVRGNFQDFFPIVGINQGIYHVRIDGAGREVVLPSNGPGGDTAARLAPSGAEGLQSFIQRIREHDRAMGR